MMNETLPLNIASPLDWVKAYFELTKPRVVALMLLTAIVGMFLAVPGMVPLRVLILGNLGIGLIAGAAATINHVVDRKIDEVMNRTKKRPLPTGRIEVNHALIFAFIVGSLGMLTLIYYINFLTAALSFITLIGYAVCYTLFLKRATPQNIVIGGIAGAMPPLLGWTAVTGHIDPNSLLLVLIIFTWTPPHFWALAIYRYNDYAQAEIPMLPVTHGIAFTKLNILLYTALMLVCSILPFVMGMSGIIYLIGALLLGGRFLYWTIRLKRCEENPIAIKTFRFSIIYLMGLFCIILIDHYFV